MTKILFSLSALIAVVIAVSSCGKADVKKASSQIAAKVNGGEISVHRINDVISHGNDILPEQARRAAARVLEQIIDQELLVQQALDARLDRDPQVMRAIEGARRQILARAYVERAASAASTESREDIRNFYEENPALFERRRIYRVRELAVVAPQEKLDALQAEAARAKGLNEVAEWLRSHEVAFDVATSSKPAERIPLDVLPRLSKMQEGQIAVFPTPRGATVVQLLRAEEAPVNEQQATPLIRQFLAGRKRLEVARAEIRRLREKAAIEYVGEFAATRPATPSQPAAASAIPGGSVGDDGHINRGLAGLR